MRMKKKVSLVFIFSILLAMGVFNLMTPYVEGVPYDLFKVSINCLGLCLLFIAFLLTLKKDRNCDSIEKDKGRALLLLICLGIGYYFIFQGFEHLDQIFEGFKKGFLR